MVRGGDNVGDHRMLQGLDQYPQNSETLIEPPLQVFAEQKICKLAGQFRAENHPLHDRRIRTAFEKMLHVQFNLKITPRYHHEKSSAIIHGETQCNVEHGEKLQ